MTDLFAEVEIPAVTRSRKIDVDFSTPVKKLADKWRADNASKMALAFDILNAASNETESFETIITRVRRYLTEAGKAEGVSIGTKVPKDSTVMNFWVTGPVREYKPRAKKNEVVETPAEKSGK